MKHVRCYECNNFGHKVKECRRKNSNTKAKGSYIIAIPKDIIRIKKMWHNSVSRHNRHRGN